MSNGFETVYNTNSGLFIHSSLEMERRHREEAKLLEDKR